MSLRPRDVLRIWDRYTRPNKPKLHICVCPERRLFLRINSDAIFEPAHLIEQSKNGFLHHDSYVELQQLVRHLNDDIRNAKHVGRMAKPQAEALIKAAQKAKTLTPEHKQIIVENLLLDDRDRKKLGDPQAAP